ncbi:hypothetical protein NQ318_018571 [Aromia moschata]|uniref:Peptidase M12B domain-containing protein n=1 Tax=Aromia moschata TaxID=1265417 RepID=A0AAV8ZFB6_9CUCU|nr:hypothetical protein NQ318_018571 [Aromia moschata]
MLQEGEKVLELVSSPNLLANNFILLETFANGSNSLVLHDEDKNCFFRGQQAALSLCNGVRGIVHSSDEDFFIIHPLPKRFHDETSNPHLLIRKTHKTDSSKAIATCPHPEKSPPPRQTKDFSDAKGNRNRRSITLRRSKRESFPDGAPAFVETAVFVDRDLFDHMKINFPVDTERELIRFVLAMINARKPPAWSDRQISTGSYQIFATGKELKNPAGDREPLHWDHALILTGLDLYVRGKHGKISSQVVGLAPVSGMCTASSSCTVNEGRHFESVYVVAHEIGHNLGMRHDGPSAENDCDPSSYIMSPTLGSGKITWSACSKRYLQKFLDTPQSRCLLDHGSSAGQLDHSAEGALPGRDLMPTNSYGRGSKHSTQQPLDDVCRDLHCEREVHLDFSSSFWRVRCVETTWGGRCVVKGLAVSAAYTSQQIISRVEKVNGGWNKWKPHSECASGCLFGEEGRLRSGSTGITVSERSCNNPRPQGNGAECEGPSTKYSTCSAQQCLNVPRLTIREFAEQICTRAKEVDKDLTGSGMQKMSSDPEEACLVWCQKRNGGTKSRGWTFPDGTACQTRRNRYGKASYCIKGSLPICAPSTRTTTRSRGARGCGGGEGAVRWKSASGCHYNCISPGSGIRLVMSKGNLGRSSIQLCQPDKYEFGSDDTPLSESEFTLPLLSRPKRSLYNNSSTKVTAKLDQKQLDEIIGNTQLNSDPKFDIDLNNPIHVDMDMDKPHHPQKYFRRKNFDYANYA